MTDAAQANMFAPLSVEEIEASEDNNDRVPPEQPQAKLVPIVPVPKNAPPRQYQHPKLGAPSKVWPYHHADGQVVGYVLRWDSTSNDGKPDKEIRPVCYCELGNGQQAWRSVGMPTPRPLLRLPDILKRPDARVLIVEGEKSADAAGK